MRCVVLRTSMPVLLAGLVLLASGAAAPGRTDEPPRIETWVGGEITGHAWALYSGLTVAPFAGIQENGLRLRASGGYGAYTYETATGLPVTGVVGFGELLVGYHAQLGMFTIKAFAGAEMSEHRLTPDDPAARVRGEGVGAKAVLETWWNLSERTWSSLDLAYGTLHESYAARARLGWRVRPALSLGIEAGIGGNIDCDIARAGGVLRYEWATGEVSLSGGVSSDRLLDDAARAAKPYATLSWLTRF